MEEALKRVVAYVRTSSRDDAEAERSLDAQEKVCSELAQEIARMEPELIYREYGSTGDPNRPALESLMQAARDGRMDVVVASDLGRLSRDMFEVFKMLQELNRLGVEFLTTS